MQIRAAITKTLFYHIYEKIIDLEIIYFAVYNINGSRFHCLNMVKIKDVNSSDLTNTCIASLKGLPSIDMFNCLDDL